MMEIEDWNERYRSGSRAAEDLNAAPTPLLVEMAKRLAQAQPLTGAQPALCALDLACGTGRNALWLAKHGWNVTAVDAAPSAIAILRDRAAHGALTAGMAPGMAPRLALDARVADLSRGEFQILPAAWDLMAICYYLQRSLFEPAKQGVVPGGIVIAIVHITEPGEEPNPHRLRPGELETYFQGWEIIHRYEGQPNDAAHQRAVAEIAARRPTA
jgi:tellurite methyltransferase